MFLSDSFVDMYNNNDVPFGGNGLGHFVYLRTYSRWNEDKFRRENWNETVRRVVEYSMKLYEGPATQEELGNEAEALFDAMFNLRVFPAGRTMWIGGTEAERKFGTANFNCAFTVVDKVEAFVEAFHLLMVGSGVGFRVLLEDVNKLPQFNSNIVVAHKPIHPKQKIERIEDTLVFEEQETGDKASILIVVGDSKGGWVSALEHYFNALQRQDVESIVINYDSVRPHGELLKTFGGRASGHQALKNMFRAIHKVVRQSNGRLKPVDAMDILNHIGANVVVGGVRRTSEIALFDANDPETLNAKVDMWVSGSPNYGQDQRSMSNNSIFFNKKPTISELENIFSRISNNGEPGFVNAEAARKRRPNFAGLNPCAEILLADRGVCNLTEINLMAFTNRSSTGAPDFDRHGLRKAVRLATRIGLRQTNVTLDLEEWDKVQKRDRLTGVSLSGIVDFDDYVYVEGEPIEAGSGLTESMKELLSSLRNTANDEAILYAKEMRVPTPLLVTTIKPSGTISKLPGVSAGVHRSRAPYYIRRVRITSSDPLAKVMLDAGYIVYPETSSNGPSVAQFDAMSQYEKMQALQTSKTWVIEFPVSTAAKVQSNEESALMQFYRYLDMQESWTDHNTSITIEFADDEVAELIDALLSNWDKYVAVSFLPKNIKSYPLLPEEPISAVEYEVRAAKVSHIKAINILEALTEIERENAMTDLLDDECATGACPVR